MRKVSWFLKGRKEKKGGHAACVSVQCSSADGDRLVRWDAREAAFFFRKRVARGSRVAVEEKALAPSKQAWLL